MKTESKDRLGKSVADHYQLMHAFTIFSQASEQLSNVYRDLQQQVEHLTNELALANGELQRQLAQKENLSQQLSLLLSALPEELLLLIMKVLLRALIQLLCLFWASRCCNVPGSRYSKIVCWQRILLASGN